MTVDQVEKVLASCEGEKVTVVLKPQVLVPTPMNGQGVNGILRRSRVEGVWEMHQEGVDERTRHPVSDYWNFAADDVALVVRASRLAAVA